MTRERQDTNLKCNIGDGLVVSPRFMRRCQRAGSKFSDKWRDIISKKFFVYFSVLPAVSPQAQEAGERVRSIPPQRHAPLCHRNVNRGKSWTVPLVLRLCCGDVCPSNPCPPALLPYVLQTYTANTGGEQAASFASDGIHFPRDPLRVDACGQHARQRPDQRYVRLRFSSWCDVSSSWCSC